MINFVRHLSPMGQKVFWAVTVVALVVGVFLLLQ